MKEKDHLTKNSAQDQEISSRENEEAIRNARTSDWFSAFARVTNEKSETAIIIARLLHLFFKKLRAGQNLEEIYSILDVGCGEGTLSYQIAETILNEGVMLSYCGIDQDPNFVSKVITEVTMLNIKAGHFAVGDCFSEEDLSKLPNNPSFILASHIAYYAPNIKHFIDNLLKKAGKDTILTFIHASHLSNHNILRRKFSAPINTQIPNDIERSLIESSTYEIINFYFTSFFPLSCESNELKRIAYSPYEELTPGEEHIRKLLEFTAQRPMESLRNEGSLDQYLEDVYNSLMGESNNFFIWANIQFAVPRESWTLEAIRSTIREYTISPPNGELSPVNWAAYQGNLGVILEFIHDPEDEVIFSTYNLGSFITVYFAIFGALEAIEKGLDYSNYKEIMKYIAKSQFKITEWMIERIRNILEHYFARDLLTFFNSYYEQATSPGQNSLPDFNNIESIDFLFTFLPNILIKDTDYIEKMLDYICENENFALLKEILQREEKYINQHGHDEFAIVHTAARAPMKYQKIFKWLKKDYNRAFSWHRSYKENIVHEAARMSICEPANILPFLKWMWINFPELFSEKGENGVSIVHYMVNSFMPHWTEAKRYFFRRLRAFDSPRKVSYEKSQEILQKVKLANYFNWLKENTKYLLIEVDDEKRNIAHQAIDNIAEEVSIAVLEWLLDQEKMADPELDKQLLALDYQGRNIAHIAAASRKLYVLDWIKQNKPDLLEKLTFNGRSIIEIAAIFNKKITLDWAINNVPLLFNVENKKEFEQEPDPEHKTHILSRSMMFYSLKNEFEDLFEVNNWEQGINFIHLAAYYDYKFALEWALEKHEELLYLKTSIGMNIAHFAMIKNFPYTNLSCLNFIKAHIPAMLLESDNYGRNLYHYALHANEQSIYINWLRENAPNVMPYYTVPIMADGNCMYNAIIEGISRMGINSENIIDANHLRRRVYNTINQRIQEEGDDLISDIESQLINSIAERNYDGYNQGIAEALRSLENNENILSMIQSSNLAMRYIESIQENGVWGGEIELRIISSELGIRIRIYRENERFINIGLDEEAPEINLQYNHGHYDLRIPNNDHLSTLSEPQSYISDQTSSNFTIDIPIQESHEPTTNITITQDNNHEYIGLASLLPDISLFNWS